MKKYQKIEEVTGSISVISFISLFMLMFFTIVFIWVDIEIIWKLVATFLIIFCFSFTLFMLIPSEK